MSRSALEILAGLKSGVPGPDGKAVPSGITIPLTQAWRDWVSEHGLAEDQAALTSGSVLPVGGPVLITVGLETLLDIGPVEEIVEDLEWKAAMWTHTFGNSSSDDPTYSTALSSIFPDPPEGRVFEMQYTGFAAASSGLTGSRCFNLQVGSDQIERASVVPNTTGQGSVLIDCPMRPMGSPVGYWGRKTTPDSLIFKDQTATSYWTIISASSGANQRPSQPLAITTFWRYRLTPLFPTGQRDPVRDQ